MACGLVSAAHHAKGHERTITQFQETGDDCMHRALAACRFIRVPFFKGKARAAIVEQNAKLVGGKARAEAVIDRVDHRNSHAIRIDHAQIHRVLMDGLRQFTRIWRGLAWINEISQGFGGVHRGHMLKAAHMVGVSDETVARVIAEFDGLGFDMGALGPEGVHIGDVEMRQDICDQNRGGPLAVRWQLNQLGIAVRAAQWGDVIAGGCGEIFQCMGAAKCIEAGDHVFGNLALIKACAAFLGNAAQHFGLFWGAEDVPKRQRFALVKEIG